MTTTNHYILVIEDSDSGHDVIALLLGSAGNFEVQNASTLKDAFVRLKSRRPDLIICDQFLPDGLASGNLSHIRGLAPHTPLIFVSGALDLNTALDVSQQGVAAIFNKPINPKALLAKARDLLENRNIVVSGSMGGSHSPIPLGTAQPFPAEPGGFRWRFFPGASQAHRNLAGQLAKVCDFRTTLLILGEPGCPFWPVVRDLHANSHLRSAPLLCIPKPDFTRSGLFTRLGSHIISENAVTIALEGIEAYDPEQLGLLRDLLDFQGYFSSYKDRLRVVLKASPMFVDDTAPSAHATDLIERIALLNVKLPAWDDLREDRVQHVRSLLAETGSEPVVLPVETIEWLEAQPWPGSYRQFRRVILTAYASDKELKRESLEKACALEPSLPEDAYETISLPAETKTANEDALNTGAIQTPPALLAACAADIEPPAGEGKKRRPRIGSYDFANRLGSTLSVAGDTPAPCRPVHPRFASKP